MKIKHTKLFLGLLCALSMNVEAPRKRAFERPEDALGQVKKDAARYARDVKRFERRAVRRDFFIEEALKLLEESLDPSVEFGEEFKKDACKEFGKVWNEVFFVSLETEDTVKVFAPQFLEGVCMAVKKMAEKEGKSVDTICFDLGKVYGFVGICQYHGCELPDETLTKIIVDAARADDRFTIAPEVEAGLAAA